MTDYPILFLRRKQKLRICLLVLVYYLALLGLTIAQADNSATNSALPGSEENKVPVLIEQNTDWNATIYRISKGGCTIEWIARNTEIGVIKHVSDCATPLALQMPLLAEIAAAFFVLDPHARSFRTLFWGMLEPDTAAGSWEMSFRLALAAYQSPGWDKKRGRPKNGDVNGFIKDLAIRAMIYPELKALFTHLNRNLTFACAEKVLVIKAEKLPFYDQLKRYGIKATDRLPFDCMAWFSVSDAPGN
jgi:hypothetical protein